MIPFKRYTVLVLCLCVCLGAASQAGKRKRRPSVAEVAVDPRIEQMIHNTQRVMFIDSAVVTRKELFSQLAMTPRSGHIWQDMTHTYHENEIGNRRIYSSSDGQLYQQSKLNGEWCDEQALSGLCEPGVIDTLYCPFLLNDGMTLYFAAKGTESIGGYDIFVTRYNTDTHTFLKPENIGMPFNSTGDELFYIIDEGANIGYLATTRRQPEGMVCIYSFIPPKTRQTYSEGYSLQQLKNLADINNIADTWSSEQERNYALERKSQTSRQPAAITTEVPVPLYIDGHTAYTSPTAFKAPSNADRFKQLTAMRRDYDRRKDELQKSRNYYAKAAQSERLQLQSDILKAEQDLDSLELSIRQLEKEIRYTETQYLND